PEVVNFFNDVVAKHRLEIIALRPKPKRYPLLNLVPPLGQFQNGDRVKGIIVGSMLGAFIATNVTTYLVIRSWCHTDDRTCDGGGGGIDHARRADQLMTINRLAGVAAVATYIYGVWDGVSGYRRKTRELQLAPYVTPSSEGGGVLGVVGSF